MKLYKMYCSILSCSRISYEFWSVMAYVLEKELFDA